MKAITHTQTTLSIQRRFFDALTAIQERGDIMGLQTFCNRYGFNRTKYSHVRTAIRTESTGRYHSIDIDALSYIVMDYGVNANWLLTGDGKMFV